LEKEVQNDPIHANTDHSVKKMVKIGPMNPEIIGFQLKRTKKKKITEGKI